MPHTNTHYSKIIERNMNPNFVSNEIINLFDGDIIELLQCIIGCIDYGIAVSRNNTTGFAVWNEKAKEILGKPQADIPPEQWASYYGIYNPITMELSKLEELPLVIAMSGKEIHNYELYVKNEVQTGTWINCVASPIIKIDKIIGGICIFQDVGKEKRMMAELAKKLSELSKHQTNLLARISN